MRSIHVVPDKTQAFTRTTCREAQETCSTTPGTRVFWRPGGEVNWSAPDSDEAQLLTD